MRRCGMAYDYSDAPALVREFLKYKGTVQGRSKLTVFNYYHDLRTFSRFLLVQKDPEKYTETAFEEIPFSDATDELLTAVSAGDIFEFLVFCNEKLDNQKASRARKLSCLRSFYKYLTTGKMILSVNPTEKIESPKKDKSLPKFLNLEESVKLLESVDGRNAERDYAIIMIFLNCGLRVSELAGIDLDDFDKDMESLVVTGKGSKQRRIFLNDACRDAIRAYLAVRPKEVKLDAKKALFISRNRNRISVHTVQWLIYKRLDEAGLGNMNMSVHKLRHTAATLMYAEGHTDVRVLKDILGHESLSTTQIYTHVQNQKLIDAANNNPLSGMKRKLKAKSDEAE